MKLDRKHLLLLGLVIIVGGFILMRMYEKKKAQQSQQQNNLGPTGSNLNSIAPELVGGSTGPSIGPALSVPIDITVTSQGSSSQMPVGSSANPIGPVRPWPVPMPVERAPGEAQPVQAGPDNVMRPVRTSSIGALGQANPVNVKSGAQAASPMLTMANTPNNTGSS